MPTYRAPVKDMMFILNDVLQIERYSNLPGFADASPEVIGAILEEGGKICEEVLQPLNMVGDKEGCTRNEDGSVTTPKGFKEAYRLFTEGGWQGLTATTDYGGQGLPYVLWVAFEEMCLSANQAFTMYPSLTAGVIGMLMVKGTDEQKKTYLPKLISGEWSGTMNLTEAHAGTDLRMIKTKAEPQDDGSYKITGEKIFISSGEHDLSENIIHTVLAKIPGGPEGVKGISLFLVPKYLINEDGTLGERNKVSCGALEEKMGIHGNATAVLNYDGATGYLIGDEHKGLEIMFIMMNGARIGVGIQGTAQSEVAYQNAADYARERLQGRALTGAKFPDQAADPIIVHPDVRRMLMESRAFTEGARALQLWAGVLADIWRKGVDQEERDRAEDLLGLLTPVIKGVHTDLGYESATNMQQVLGGHGYIREWGLEQFVRDARITMIYEGTNGIQALDLVGRKLPHDNGQAIRAYLALLTHFCEENADSDYEEFVKPLKGAIQSLQQATLWLAENGMANPDNAGAGAVSYMHLFGRVALAHMWAKMAITAKKALAEGGGDKAFLEAKITTARYYFSHMLPETLALLARIEAGADDIMALPAESF